ncbi:MAG: hypothetical protein IT438_04595 [Phycisphaerales bacterium]|nr:hypothetical protein [Phycisphaerales bacterium]
MNAAQAILAAVVLSAAVPALADDGLPPFDFSDAFYRANGVDPAQIPGRPTGANANSVIDNRENGPDFNNVRVLQHVAAYDHSGHRIFFYVTGIVGPNTFLNNAAGREARRIADQYKVYEFPRAANAPFAVFPKRQDLIADLRNGYFGNDPLGLWQVNDVRYTPAALNTENGRRTLAELAARNGADIDGTPIIKTISEIEDLEDDGFVTIDVPPADGTALRWFFCPVIEDPRDGATARDAHVEVTGNSDAAAFRSLFDCLQTTGREDCSSSGGRRSDCNGDGSLGVGDVFLFLDWYFTSDDRADFDASRTIAVGDIFTFLAEYFAGI